MNNYIQRDRYTPSIYTEEKQRLSIAENGRYSYMDTQCIQDVSKSDTQVREELGEIRKEIAENKAVYRSFSHAFDGLFKQEQLC